MTKRGETWHAEVLDIMRRDAAPVSAYDLLDELREHHAKISPPTIYRTLAALIKRGRIHRVESINAYVACQCDAHDIAPVISICDECGTIEERVAPDLLVQLSALFEQSGFKAQRHVIEVHGVCQNCNTAQVTT